MTQKRTWEEKVAMVNTIDSRPEGVSKVEMFKRFGIGKGKLYYDTKAEMVGEMIREYKPSVTAPETAPTAGSILIPIIEAPKMKRYTITLNAEVGSIMELIGFCNEICQLPKVKAILSVE